MSEFIFRKATSDELPFIFSSWLKSYFGGSSFTRDIPAKIYYKYHHFIIERILANENTSIIVATHKEVPDTIVGWIVFQNGASDNQDGIIHYCYVKHSFRKAHLGTQLKKLTGYQKAIVTHLTPQGRFLLGPDDIYVPYLI